jgi:hypothetical protein
VWTDDARSLLPRGVGVVSAFWFLPWLPSLDSSQSRDRATSPQVGALPASVGDHTGQNATVGGSISHDRTSGAPAHFWQRLGAWPTTRRRWVEVRSFQMDDEESSLAGRVIPQSLERLQWMLSRDSSAASPNRWADYGASRPDRTSAKCEPPYVSACVFMSVQCFDSRACVTQQHPLTSRLSAVRPRSWSSRTRTSLGRLVPLNGSLERAARCRASLGYLDMQVKGSRFKDCP